MKTHDILGIKAEGYGHAIAKKYNASKQNCNPLLILVYFLFSYPPIKS